MQKVFREIKKQPYIYRTHSLNFSAHIHEDIELVFVKRGGGIAYCDGKKYTLRENTFFIVFPNQVHRYEECDSGEYILLILKPTMLLSYRNVFLEGLPVSAEWRLNDAKNDNLVYLLETVVYEYNRDGYSPIISAYLTAIFGKLLKVYEIQKSNVSGNTVLQILEYCSEHYKENISVGEIAQKLHISRSCVSHIFSSRLAMNFCDYINSLRLADAVQLLKSGNYSVTEVSNLSGFSTLRTFNRAFLKKYGVPPSKYGK